MSPRAKKAPPQAKFSLDDVEELAPTTPGERALRTATKRHPAAKPPAKAPTAKKSTARASATKKSSAKKSPTKQSSATKTEPVTSPTRQGRAPAVDSARSSAGDESRRVIREYLRSLSSPRPRGRPVDVENLKARRDTEPDPVEQLLITQRILDTTTGPSRAELEARFVKVAHAWGQENGVSWGAWREAGVAPSVLRAAGISR